MGTLKKASMLLVALTLLSITSIFANTGWTRVDYTSSTTFVGFILETDGYVTGAQPGDSIGAFVGDECRMKAELFYGPGNDTLFVSSVIHGGGINPPSDPSPVPNDGEEVTFKIWRASTGVEDIAGTATTIPGGDIFMFPLGKTAVVVSDDATLTTVEVAGATLTPAFDAATTTYEVELASGSSLPADTDYTITPGSDKADVVVDYATDFTTDASTTITVTAEDGTTEIVYTIEFIESACDVVAPTVEATKEICEGQTAEVSAEGLAGATFEWKDATDKVVSSEALLSTTEAGVYYVTQTTSCTGPAASVTVTVNALPEIAVATDHALINAICETSVIDLTGVSSTAGVEYSGTGVSGDIANGFELSAATAGVATDNQILISLEDVNGCIAEEKTIVYEVVALPSASLTLGFDVVCSDGDVVTLATQGTPAGGVYTVDGSATTEFNPSLYTATAEIAYTVSSTPGCEATDKAGVTINATPSAPAVEDQVVVLPATVEAFTVTAENGAEVIWYDENSQVIVGANATYTPNESTVGIYTYTVTQKIGDCESEATTVKLTITDCEAEAPTLDKTEGEVCQGELVTCTATPVSGSEIFWTDEDGAPIEAENNTISMIANEVGTFVFYASQKSTAANSCESPQAKVTLVVNEVPEVSITIPATPLTVSSDPVEITLTPATATLSGTGIEGNVFTPATAGVGTHELTATFTTDAACTNTITENIVVGADAVDNSALLTAIADAKAKTATTGYAQGEYIDPTDANTALANAITAAELVQNSEDSDVLAQALLDLNAAVEAFEDAANVIDYTELKAAIDAADAKITLIGTNVGDQAGEYATDEVQALKDVVAPGDALYAETDASVVATLVDDIKTKTAIEPIEDLTPDRTVLLAAIEEATVLLSSTTEGTAVGEYEVGSKTSLTTALNTANGLTTSMDQQEVNTGAEALAQAIALYKTKINTAVDTDVLKQAISSANTTLTAAVEGYLVGNYVDLDTKNDDLEAAIATANEKLLEFATAGTLAEVEAAAVALNNAVEAFEELANTIDYTSLVTAINDAQDVRDNTIGTNIGVAVGQYSSEDVATLEATIADAKALIGSIDASAITTAISELASASDVTPNAEVQIDYTALNTEITKAKQILAGATVGSEPGQYTQDVYSALDNAIQAAEAFTTTDQTAVQPEVIKLVTAVETFEAAVNPDAEELDYKDLIAKIEEAQEISDDAIIGSLPGNVSGVTWGALEDAIEVANGVKTSATTQDEITSAISALNDAIVKYNSEIIVVSIEGASVAIEIYPTLVKESVTIAGISTVADIVVASTSGVVVFTATTDANTVIVNASELIQGVNTITITLEDGSVATQKIIVE